MCVFIFHFFCVLLYDIGFHIIIITVRTDTHTNTDADDRYISHDCRPRE